MLQSHSAVHSGSHHRSYHGTTIQLVQPKSSFVYPTYSTENQKNCTSQSNIFTPNLPLILPYSQPSFNEHISQLPRWHHVTQSTSNSPHKLGKEGPKKQHTVAIQNLSYTLSDHPTVQSTSQHCNQHLILEYFQILPTEENEYECTFCNLSSYIIMKIALKDEGLQLRDMRLFLSSPEKTVFLIYTLHGITKCECRQRRNYVACGKRVTYCF